MLLPWLVLSWVQLILAMPCSWGVIRPVKQLAVHGFLNTRAQTLCGRSFFLDNARYHLAMPSALCVAFNVSRHIYLWGILVTLSRIPQAPHFHCWFCLSSGEIWVQVRTNDKNILPTSVWIFHDLQVLNTTLLSHLGVVKSRFFGLTAITRTFDRPVFSTSSITVKKKTSILLTDSMIANWIVQCMYLKNVSTVSFACNAYKFRRWSIHYRNMNYKYQTAITDSTKIFPSHFIDNDGQVTAPSSQTTQALFVSLL